MATRAPGREFPQVASDLRFHPDLIARRSVERIEKNGCDVPRGARRPLGAVGKKPGKKRRHNLGFFAAFVAKEGQLAPAALILDDDLFMSQVRDRVAVFVESDESELDQRGPGAEDRNFVLCERGETERQ
jgi:hypothetical protein